MQAFDETSLFTVESVNPLTLPFAWLSERTSFPCKMAVYFVISSDDEVLYIGRTRDLFARWRTHHRLKQFTRIQDVRVSWITIEDAVLLPLIEKALIAHFRPPFNGSRLPVEDRGEHGIYSQERTSSSAICLKWNLRQLMADRKVKNKDLAEALGVHWTSISRMKSADEMPRIDGKSLATICKVLHCRLTELIEETDCVCG